jgi:hypothetical protein
MILNITHSGISTNHEVEGLEYLDDDDIRMIATEISKTDLTHFVVDRIDKFVYVRPKVPFGGGA